MDSTTIKYIPGMKEHGEIHDLEHLITRAYVHMWFVVDITLKRMAAAKLSHRYVYMLLYMSLSMSHIYVSFVRMQLFYYNHFYLNKVGLNYNQIVHW